MDYSLFEKVLTRRVWVISVLCFIFLLIAIFSLIYIIKNLTKEDSLKEKIELHIVNILCIIVIVGSLILSGNIIYGSVYDIKNHSYIVYNGNFVVSDDANTSTTYYGIYIPDRKGIHLEASNYTEVMEPGEYFGKVVYGEKSKVAFEIDAKGEGQGDGSPVS